VEGFPDTSWTAVYEARERHSEAARQALARLVADYAAPIVAFVRRFGVPADDADDVAHTFIMHFFLEGIPAGNADPGHGRLRSYLCGALRHFLLNRQACKDASIRRPPLPVVSLEEIRRSSGAIPVSDNADTPEQALNRQWAREVLARAVSLTRRRLETDREGQWPVFERLALGGADAPSYADVARALGITESQVRYRLHAARLVFQEALRDVVAETVASPADVDDELRDLFEALS